MKIFGKTDIGLVRSTNQDAFSYQVIGEDIGYALVCDGMGGANGGNVASQTAVRVISENLYKGIRPNLTLNSVKNLLEGSVAAANTEVYRQSLESEELKGMGTTMVCAFVLGETVCISNIGDSRAYLFDGETLQRLTVDHSIVQEMLENGEISELEAKNHPRKNLITRAIGISQSIADDYFEYDIKKGQKLLLCTDGLTNHLENFEITAILSETSDEEQTIENLITLAKENGGSDNITVILISL